MLALPVFHCIRLVLISVIDQYHFLSFSSWVFYVTYNVWDGKIASYLEPCHFLSISGHAVLFLRPLPFSLFPLSTYITLYTCSAKFSLTCSVNLFEISELFLWKKEG